jgi:hypothetical protein
MKIGITCDPTYGGSGAVATDLFLLPCKDECFGLAALEAMAETGTEVFPDSTRGFAMSAAVRTAAVERFSNNRVVPLYEALYRDVVKGGNGQ